MKHQIKTSLLLLAFCLPLAAAAYDFEVGGVYYITDLWGDYAMVCDQGEDGDHYSGIVSIPAVVPVGDETLPVTKINAYAFSNCSGLTGVSIPESVNEIGDHSFENCTGLSSIVIPDAVTEIGAAAFDGCTGFTRIDIPAGVTKIGVFAFSNCTNLTDVYCHIADPSQVDLSVSFGLEDEDYAKRTLHVPAGSAAAYKNSSWWSDYFGKIVEM
jgi:hypothetical protein